MFRRRRLDAYARERESWNHAKNDVGRPPFGVQISDPKAGVQNLDPKMEPTRRDVLGAGALSKNGANKSAGLHRHGLVVPAPPLFVRRAGCCSQLRIFANSSHPGPLGCSAPVDVLPVWLPRWLFHVTSRHPHCLPPGGVLPLRHAERSRTI